MDQPDGPIQIDSSTHLAHLKPLTFLDQLIWLNKVEQGGNQTKEIY